MVEATHILLVDDECEVTELLRRRLEHRGYACSTAASGETALAMLEASPAQLVILDVKMPGMDGMTTLAHIRERCPQLPVILLSGHADMQTAVNAIREGAFGYLMKPVEFDELLFKIEDALTQARLEKDPV